MPVPVAAILTPLVEGILVSLGLMGVEAAVSAANAAAAAGGGPEAIAAAAAKASGKSFGKGAVGRAAALGERAAATTSATRRGTEEALAAHAERSAAAEAAASKKWFGKGGRVGRLTGGGITALFVLTMLPSLLEMLKGRGGEGEGMGGMPPSGGGEQDDILKMLASMQGGGFGAGSDLGDLRDLATNTGAQVDTINRRAFLGSSPSTMGTGSAGLEELIRGNRELLGQIAYTEPVSLAQAYARHGLYGSPETPSVDFRGII
jgi:hypothetical protein